MSSFATNAPVHVADSTEKSKSLASCCASFARSFAFGGNLTELSLCRIILVGIFGSMVKFGFDVITLNSLACLPLRCFSILILSKDRVRLFGSPGIWCSHRSLEPTFR